MKLIIGLVGFTSYILLIIYYFSLIDPGPCVKLHLEVRHKDVECLPTTNGVVKCHAKEDWTEEVCDKWEKMK